MGLVSILAARIILRGEGNRMSAVPGLDITDLVRAQSDVFALQLPLAQQAILRGPCTDAQRLLELQIVLDSASAAAQGLAGRGHGQGVVLVSQNGSQFWYVPFADMPQAVPGLPDDAHELLAMVRQVYDVTHEAVIALLLPQHKAKLLYMARDGMRGQTYARQRVTPRIDRATPSDIIAQATITDGGFVIHLRQTELGLLGRVVVSALGENHLFIEGHVAGHPHDPATNKRQAVLQPIIETLERALSSAGSDLVQARALVEGLLTPGKVSHDVPRQIATRICPCTHCGGPIAFLIFAEDADLTLEDYARMMFEVTHQHRLPTWIIRSGPLARAPADAIKVYPQRELLRRMAPSEFEELIDGLSDAHCRHRSTQRPTRRGRR